jgi:Protein of unknown function DUF262/Protein of unknown function (DUF1524)
MADNRYDAARQTIGAQLATTSPRLEVPEWQRSYSWDRSQVETFWQDLRAFSDQYPDKTILDEEYFLGSIVLVVGGAKHLLLDGQQRLATATILLAALRDGRRGHVADAATRLQTKYIADFDDQSSTTTYVLTLNRYDSDFFRSEIQTEPNPALTRPKPTLRSHGLIRRAREFFEARVAEHSEALGGGDAAFQWNLRISDVLCNHMSVVAVTSTDEDNAAAVFETLNDRGIGLSTPDLLRNLLLRRAEDDDSRDRIVAAWGIVLGIADEASVDEFLRHYWVSHRGDVKSRKLYREIKSRITEENTSSLTLSLDLAESAAVYRDIVSGRADDPDLKRLLIGMGELGAKALYPAVLAAYSAVGEEADTPQGVEAQTKKLRAMTRALTTLFVRHNVIGGRDTTGMETTVYEVAAQLRRDQDFDAAIATLAALSPQAGEFVTDFARVSISRAATARYLLREIEHAKRVTAEVTVSGPDKVHLEHIYPQTPQASKWPRHAQMINRLGNLTLLGKRFNTSVKNADFAKKKEKAYESSDILMTKELLPLDTWDEDAVAERQREMSEWAFDIWSFPGETAPQEASSEGGGAATVEMLASAAPSGNGKDQEPVSPDQLPEVPE